MNSSIHQLLSQSLQPTAVSPAQHAVENKQSAESDQEARETAKKFEALLVHTMLKNMRSASIDNPLLKSDQVDLYNDMFDQQISRDISTNGTFGLADVIYRQLKDNPTKTPETATIRNLSAADANTLHYSRGKSSNTSLKQVSTIHAVTPDQDKSQSLLFIERIEAQATNTAQRLGAPTEAIIAIAALETGWGKRVPRNPDGSSSNNLFGIKADPGWNGHQSISQTNEYRNGEFTVEYAAFRSYPNEQQSIEDFASFLEQNPRYQKVLSNAIDGEDFINELQRAGYATDPGYANKAIAVMRQAKFYIK